MYTHFQASQTVEMAVPEPTLIHHYLRQPKRLVKVESYTDQKIEIDK